VRTSQEKRKRKGVIVDLGTTLEERGCRSATPEECVQFVGELQVKQQIAKDVAKRLINARTLVLMAACAYIPTDATETTRQGFLSLEKAVLEYRAAVRQDERSRKVTVTWDSTASISW
jgi:hypothetical protein